MDKQSRDMMRDRFIRSTRNTILEDIGRTKPTDVACLVTDYINVVFRTLLSEAQTCQRCREPSLLAVRIMTAAKLMRVPLVDRQNCCIKVALKDRSWTISWYGDFADSDLYAMPEDPMCRGMAPFRCPVFSAGILLELDGWLSWLEATAQTLNTGMRSERMQAEILMTTASILVEDAFIGHHYKYHIELTKKFVKLSVALGNGKKAVFLILPERLPEDLPVIVAGLPGSPSLRERFGSNYRIE